MTAGEGREARRGRRHRGEGAAEAGPVQRRPNYRNLRNPMTPQTIFSEDQVEAIHQDALTILEDLGLKVLLPQARDYYRQAGALVDDDTQMVRIGREIVEAALASAPRSFVARAGDRSRDFTFELGQMGFIAGCGSPHATDIDRGKRPGTLEDFEALVRLSQAFDVLHAHAVYVEPQDVPHNIRHLAIQRAQLANSDKLTNIISRGSPQIADSFEMIKIARGLSHDAFVADVHCFTIINTNSPRVLDIPMAQGIIDFAAAGQMSVITPFCLAGAMAPITIAGALLLQHAEALAGIALAQIVRAGAPVVYGSFSSNVDMRSGSPAFGTPEHLKATLGAGQLARRLGLPWRSGAGSAANIADAQAANETQFSLWGSMLAGATLCVHAAGWIEGGLSVSLEKFITDLEVLQMMGELCVPTPGDADSIGREAIAGVAPGGHFFASSHTMSRYRTAFYEPLVADWSNFGQWTDSGGLDATQRANRLWKQVLADFQPPASAVAAIPALDAFIARRTEEGGAPPVS